MPRPRLQDAAEAGLITETAAVRLASGPLQVVARGEIVELWGPFGAPVRALADMEPAARQIADAEGPGTVLDLDPEIEIEDRIALVRRLVARGWLCRT